MKRFFGIIFCALLLCGEAVSAQELSFTLDDARAMALESNATLSSSREALAASKDRVAVAKTYNLPNLSLSATALYTTNNIEERVKVGFLPIYVDVDVEFGFMYNASLMLTQPIYMGGKIRNTIKLAKVGVEASELGVVRSEAEVVKATDEAFYKVLEVEEMLKAAEGYQRVVDEFYRQAENATAQGMMGKNDLLKVTVKKNEAQLMTQKAENGLRLARMNYCYTVGLPLETSDFTLIDPMFDEDEIVQDSLDISLRPEYLMLAKQVEAKELEVKIQRSDYLPSISAVASYGYSNGASINEYPLVDGAGFTGGVMLKVPIFHWCEGIRAVSAKKREVKIAENELKDLSEKMRLELMQSINSYNESLLEVELMEVAVAQAAENMRQSKLHYESGMETIADYLESQALWQKSMSDLCRAKSLRRTSYTNYLRCSGGF